MAIVILMSLKMETLHFITVIHTKPTLKLGFSSFSTYVTQVSTFSLFKLLQSFQETH